MNKGLPELIIAEYIHDTRAISVTMIERANFPLIMIQL